MKRWDWLLVNAVAGLGIGVLGCKAGWPLWLTAAMAMFMACGGALLERLAEPVFAKWAAKLK